METLIVEDDFTSLFLLLQILKEYGIPGWNFCKAKTHLSAKYVPAPAVIVPAALSAVSALAFDLPAPPSGVPAAV